MRVIISIQRVQNQFGPLEQYRLLEPPAHTSAPQPSQLPTWARYQALSSPPRFLATSVLTWLFSMRAVPRALWFWSATSFQYCSVGGGGRSGAQGGGGGGGGGDPKAGGSSDGERQDPKDETSQGEKGKSPSVRGGDIKEDESGRKQELDWLPPNHAQLATGAGGGGGGGMPPRHWVCMSFIRQSL